jgi:hypothetical protein
MFDVCAPIAVSKSSSYIHNTRRVSVPTADEARAPKSDSLSDEGIEGRLARPRKWMASVYTKDRHLGIQLHGNPHQKRFDAPRFSDDYSEDEGTREQMMFKDAGVQ